MTVMTGHFFFFSQVVYALFYALAYVFLRPFNVTGASHYGQHKVLYYTPVNIIISLPARSFVGNKNIFRMHKLFFA